MANIKWTQEQKLKALAIAEATSVYAAAEQTGIPAGTIMRWRKETGASRKEPTLPVTRLEKRSRKQTNHETNHQTNQEQTNHAKRIKNDGVLRHAKVEHRVIEPIVEEALEEAQQAVKEHVEDRAKRLAESIFEMTEVAAREAIKIINEGPKDEETKAQWLRSVIGAIAQGSEKYQLLTGKPTSRQHVEGEMKTTHERHYHITQEIVSAHPELVDVIFGRGVEDRGGEG